MIDIAKLPLPPADYEPTVADWRRYQDVVRPLVEVELLSQLRRDERELIKRGWKDLDVCMDYELGYDIYMDKLRTARVLAFAREQQAARAIPRQPAEVRPEPSLDLVDPAVMHWSPSAEDLEWMERALSPKAHRCAPAAPSMAKAQLLYWYLDTFLPSIAAKGTIFSVLIALLKASPDDLSSFRMSNRKLATEAGVNLRRIPDAIRELEARGVLLVVTEGKWSDRGPQAAVIPEYSLVPVEKIK